MIELPPLHRFVQDFHRTREMPDGPWCFYDQVEARERILRERIAELEAVLEKFDERWLMDGELGFCVVCGVSLEGGDSHKPDCWLSEANAARGKS